MTRRWPLAIAALAACFTGDGLLGQPCRTDADCNAVAAALGAEIACQSGACGAVCGDGVVVEVAEECDDGNTDDSDDCVQCRKASCGDGAVLRDIEECDDGNSDDSDGCVRCKLAVCGDGFTWVDKEECDDGNAASDDDCAGCQVAVCNDGVVNPLTEACDDGNADENDGCTSACEQGAERLSTGLADHSCAIRRGALRCWGRNESGQLGYGHVAVVGDEPGDLPPADVPVGGEVVDVVAGFVHTCALLAVSEDNLRCWGSNQRGQLGLPGTDNLGDDVGELPAAAVKVGDRVVQLATAVNLTCAILVGGDVRCWGNGLEDSALLGYGYYPGQPIGDDEDPADYPPLQLGGPAVQLAAGWNHICAVLAGGDVRCWGYAGALGYPGEPETIGDDEVPAARPPVQLGGPALQVGVGFDHSCALLADGAVRCWGSNITGALGYPGVTDVGLDEHPAERGPVDLGGRALAIAVGGRHNCALLEDGEVRCWGENYFGQLGNGLAETIGDDEPPGKIEPVELPGPALQVVTGMSHTCARLDGGAVHCWGWNGGTLALGHTQPVGDTPELLPPAAARLYETR